MSFVEYANYKPPIFFKNPHIQSIYPRLFRKFRNVLYSKREKIITENDFFYLDWKLSNSNNLAIIIHGVGANSYYNYVLGMVKILSKVNYDIAAINLRGSMNGPNNNFQTYHGGFIDDLKLFIGKIVNINKYEHIILIGFSLGGVILINYLNTLGDDLPEQIHKTACISTVFNLSNASKMISDNLIYRKYILSRMVKILIQKQEKFPDKIRLNDIKKFKIIEDFDNYYTAPAFSFKNAQDYYTKCSVHNKLAGIKVPTLLINSEDDPFLDKVCLPIKQAKQNDFITFYITKYGGHTGFVLFNKENEYWHEKKVVEFILNH